VKFFIFSIGLSKAIGVDRALWSVLLLVRPFCKDCVCVLDEALIASYIDKSLTIILIKL